MTGPGGVKEGGGVYTYISPLHLLGVVHVLNIQTALVDEGIEPRIAFREELVFCLNNSHSSCQICTIFTHVCLRL